MMGKHIELFLVDGEPGGITTAEIAGWTGHVLAGPRSKLAEVLGRPEAQRNGAYFLIGEDESAIGGTQCYIGRTENFVRRFRDHDVKKDFWDRVVLISAKDDAFNEGHWGYLEARLVELAREAARVSVLNDQTPQGRKLSEAQVSDMESFLSQLHIVLPVLGVQAIRARVEKPSARDPEGDRSPIFRLTDNRRGVEAEAQVIDGEFFVLKGSRIVSEWTAVGKSDSTRRAYAGYRERHKKLVADGSVVVEAGVATVARDIPFTSPSLSGAVALGRSCNGRKDWVWNSRPYADWEMRGVDSTAEEAAR